MCYRGISGSSGFQKRLIGTFCIAIAVFLVFVSAVNAGTVLEVCPSGCTYSGIQEAIDAANNSDTVLVKSGTYYENLNVNKMIILKGEDGGGGMPVVDAKGNGSAIRLSKTGIRLEGFTVKNSDKTMSGIYVNSKDNILSNLNIENNYYGIFLSGYGNNTIGDNIVISNYVGIAIFSYSNDNVLADNNISGNTRGIYLLLSRNNELKRNELSDNKNGLYLESSDDNSLEDNEVSSNINGIYMESSDNNEFRRNEISNNDKGIFLVSSRNNRIYYNNLIGNVIQAFDDLRNTYDSGNSSSGGNFWSDYTGNDTNGNGIGDTPYIIAGNNSQDEFPFMKKGGWLLPRFLSISINNGSDYTNSTDVTLHILATNATEVSFSNNISEYAGWIPYETTKSWVLASGDGKKIVHFIARNDAGDTAPVNDAIVLDTLKPAVTNLSISSSVPSIMDQVNITVNVSDENPINTSGIFVTVEHPDKFKETLKMDSSGEGHFYRSYTNTSKYGRYYVMVSASDLAGNMNTSGKTWFVTTMPPFNSSSIETVADNVTRIDVQKEANATLDLVTSSNVTGGHIRIAMSNDIPPEMDGPQGGDPLRKYLFLDVSNIISDNLDRAVLKIYYTDDEISSSNLAESSLKISRYNESSGKWESPGATGLNTTDLISNYSGYVWANTSNLSAFTIVGSHPVTATIVSSGGGGGSGGSSAGSSGGGGGGASDEEYSNIELKEKYSLHIFKDKETRYRFRNSSNPIMYINITGNINAGEIDATVEVLRNISSMVRRQAPGTVYKIMNIWVGTSGFASPKNIKDAVIAFKVENSWLDRKSLGGSDLELMRWDGSTWATLGTSKIISDSKYTYFEANTTGFHHFVITATKKERSAGLPEMPNASTETEKISPTPSPAMTMPKYNLFLIIGMIILIAIFSGLYLRREKWYRLKRKGN